MQPAGGQHSDVHLPVEASAPLGGVLLVAHHDGGSMWQYDIKEAERDGGEETREGV